MATIAPPTTAKAIKATTTIQPKPLFGFSASSLRHMRQTPPAPRAILCFLQMARVSFEELAGPDELLGGERLLTGEMPVPSGGCPASVRLDASSQLGSLASGGRGPVSERRGEVVLRPVFCFLDGAKEA